jgi:hypothetical protein
MVINVFTIARHWTLSWARPAQPTSPRRHTPYQRRGRVINTLLRIQQVPRSNLGPETGYPDLRFIVVFFDPSRQMSGYYLKLGHDRFHPHPFRFIVHFYPFSGLISPGFRPKFCMHVSSVPWRTCFLTLLDLVTIACDDEYKWRGLSLILLHIWGFLRYATTMDGFRFHCHSTM